MNRIFHARVMWYMFLLLLVLTILTIFLLWEKNVLMGGCMLLLMVVVIEQIIHTTYIITGDGTLVIEKGRFLPKVIIPLHSIESIEKCHSVNFGKLHLVEYVLIHYSNGKTISIVPAKADELINYMNQKRC